MNRYDFVYLFDVKDANPNGDPDAGNLPRVDPETGHGLVTDVCLKRKIRNFVGLTKGEQPPFDIYVKEKAVLNRQHERAYKACNLTPEKNKLPKKLEDAKRLTAWMCGNFYDVRAFGAVMTLEVNCGQVRGPVQIAFARSVDPIVSSEHSITRMAVATEREAAEQQGDNRTMGRKFTVPYGLYRTQGFVNPFLAEQTGFSEDDLKLLWEALINAFQFDQSAARPAGSMAARKLIVFKHEKPLGSAASHVLFDLVKVERKKNPARDFSDYDVRVDRAKVPQGVEPIEML